MPDIRFWIHGPGEKPATWATANKEQKRKAIDRAIQGFTAIANEIDWISPWLYDIYRNEDFTVKHEKQSMILAQQQWALAKCAVARKLSDSRAQGPIPVIPMFCPYFAPGGNVATKTLVSEDEFTTDILEPVVAFGVDGLSTWNELGFRVSNAFRTTINQHQVGIRDKSRKVLTELLFKDDYFNWNLENSERRIQDLIRPVLVSQFRMMRAELDHFDTPDVVSDSAEPGSKQ